MKKNCCSYSDREEQQFFYVIGNYSVMFLQHKKVLRVGSLCDGEELCR